MLALQAVEAAPAPVTRHEHPDPERYCLYVLERGELRLLATAESPAAIGVALFTQDDDCRQAGLRGLIDRGPVGILDATESRWIIMPWRRRPSNATLVA